jgi:hypothetical protein
MRIRNVHERKIPRGTVGRLIDDLGAADDPLWPWEKWPKMRFDRPLAPGAEGGHGPVRYAVDEYEPGKRVRFGPISAPRGLHGFHEFAVTQAGSQSVLRHVLEGEVRGISYITWPLIFRPLHDALLEDALDKAELVLTGVVRAPASWSLWVRILRWAFQRSEMVRARFQQSRRGLSPLMNGSHDAFASSIEFSGEDVGA